MQLILVLRLLAAAILVGVVWPLAAVANTAAAPSLGAYIFARPASGAAIQIGEQTFTSAGTVTASATWSNVAAGTYMIVAEAVDGGGLVGYSAGASVTVNPPPTVTNYVAAETAILCRRPTEDGGNMDFRSLKWRLQAEAAIVQGTEEPGWYLNTAYWISLFQILDSPISPSQEYGRRRSGKYLGGC